MFEYSDIHSLPYYSFTEITIRVSGRLLKGVLDAFVQQTNYQYLYLFVFNAFKHQFRPSGFGFVKVSVPVFENIYIYA